MREYIQFYHNLTYVFLKIHCAKRQNHAIKNHKAGCLGIRHWKSSTLGVIEKWWKEGYLKWDGNLEYQMWMSVTHDISSKQVAGLCLRCMQLVCSYLAWFFWVHFSVFIRNVLGIKSVHKQTQSLCYAHIVSQYISYVARNSHFNVSVIEEFMKLV